MFETTSKIIHQSHFTTDEIVSLNATYRPLTAEERIKQLYIDFELNAIMLTSSFAATSAFLLKLVSDINKNQKVFFIDTGYHFEDTLNYKNVLTDTYDLNVTSISAIKEEHEFTTKNETWKKNPDFCCAINKVKPLDLIKKKYTIWMSGLMEWQSDHRATLDVFELRNNILKFYPLLDITKENRDAYVEKHQLPFHPLVAKGYHSIGCEHCTVPGENRGGRWNNSPKTECGLHL
jgi:phosphoadenosine phosphosulfate reductase